jgi:hypothetical protein
MNMVICKTSFNNSNNNYNFFSISNASNRTMIASSKIRKCFAEINTIKGWCPRDGWLSRVGAQEIVLNLEL